ncbi:L-threonine 3-dehydrogenase [Aureococcus anophagefferens]|nr:L-threonine 3-dehydrogenase [Aureococcus anophagefferens]
MHTPEYLEERLRYELKQQEPAYDLKTTPQLPFAQDEENYTMEAWKDGAPAALRGRDAARAAAARAHTILVIGAAGAIGRRLVAALADYEPGCVVCALRRTPLDEPLASKVTCEFGVDVSDEATIRAVVRKYKATLTTVDSIGSFGARAREDATARWLAEHPSKTRLRLRPPEAGLPRAHEGVATAHGFDCRWAVIPGVLHEDATWGGGTTEYALDAIRCAAEARSSRARARGAPAHDPRRRPRRGAPGAHGRAAERLTNPEAGYALAGFSFAASELFDHLAAPRGLRDTVALDPAAAAFAALWPDRLGQAEAIADLGFVADIAFERRSTASSRRTGRGRRRAPSARAGLLRPAAAP